MQTGWHLDRRVPIALIFAIAAQTGAAIWWIAKTESRIQVVENTLQARTPIVDRFLKVEADTYSLRVEVMGRLDRIENKVDRLIERQASENRTRFPQVEP